MKLTSKEAAEILEINEPTLRQWRVKEAGPAYSKVGFFISYDKKDVLKWIKANTTKHKAGYATKAYMGK